MISAFLWSGLASALSIGFYGLFLSLVGVGVGSDAFFGALAVAQGLGGLLYAPYESFAQRFALDRQRLGRSPALPLVLSYLILSLILLVPYYLWGEEIGKLFGRAHAAAPALWRYHLRLLGALIPLNGITAVLQVCCQVRARYDLPKVALVVGRVAAILMLLAAGSQSLKAISIALVTGQIIAAGLSARGVGGWAAPNGCWRTDVGVILKEWFHVNRWTMVLKTDSLLERVLAARVTSGFLSLFSLGWSVVMSVVEAFQSSYVVADSNRYYASPDAVTFGSWGRLASVYSRSTSAAARLTGMAVVVAVVGGLSVMVGGWSGRWTHGLSTIEIMVLLVTLVIAQFMFFVWKQLQGAYTIQGRAVEFGRVLALVYVGFVGPRILFTWRYGAFGFCAGLIAYYGSQIGVLGRRV